MEKALATLMGPRSGCRSQVLPDCCQKYSESDLLLDALSRFRQRFLRRALGGGLDTNLTQRFNGNDAALPVATSPTHAQSTAAHPGHTFRVACPIATRRGTRDSAAVYTSSSSASARPWSANSSRRSLG